jgi:vitamin B12 transporter
MSTVRCFFVSRLSIFIVVLLSINGTVIRAEDRLDTTKVYNIDEVIVTEHYIKTGTRSSTPLQILSSSQISQLNVLQVSDAVKFFSGVTVKDYGGIGGLKTVSVRSLGAEHTAVNYDGITLTDCQTGQIDIGRFSLENIETLSLNNGQNDNIFLPARSFASAAVLNIRTKTPVFEKNKTLNGKLSLKGGSFGMINPAFLLEKKFGNKISALLSSEWLTANGEYPYILNYSYLENGITSKEIRKNSDVQNLKIEGNLYAGISEKESGFLKVYYYQSDRGLPGATIFYNENAFTSQHLNDNTFFTQLHYQNDFSHRLAFQANAKYHRGYVHYTDSATLNTAGYEDSRYAQNEFYASTSLLYRVVEHFSVDFSADGFVNDMSAKYENDALTSEFAHPTRYSLLSVVAAKYVNEQFMATGSLLSTNVVQKTTTDNATKNYNRLSPYISFTYKPFKDTDFRIRAFYKNIFRLPTFNDLYYGRVGNADLKPETTRQFNAGLTYSFDINKKTLPFFVFSIDFYNNSIQDKIVAMPTKNVFIWSMTNLGKVDITGLDLTTETGIQLSDKTQLKIGGTYTYQRALDVTTPGGETYKHQIPYTPRVSGTGQIGIQSPWIDVAYALVWSGARYAGYQNYAENRLQGYSDHSISASHKFKLNKLALLLKIEVLNLLNENYEIIRYFPMPGRSFRATVNFKF